MPTKFYPLTIREVRRETADTVSVSFTVPTHLADTFQFTQGQYLTLRTTIDGEDVRRSYSICTGVQEGDLRVAIKKVYGGVFSTYANEHLRAGDVLEVMPPQGRFFTPFNADNENLYVGFAAGSGITPVMSILKTMIVAEPKSRFVLFYGNRGFDQIVFREQLEDLKSRFPDRLSVHHVLSRESMGADLFYGRITAEKCARYADLLFPPNEVDAYFLCGPEEMIFEVKETLENKGVSAKKIHFELFTSPGAKKTAAQTAAAIDHANAFDAQVKLIQDGTIFEFTLPSDGSFLLDAAMRAGADLPFACKGGVCCTCKAKVLEGEVSMDVCYGLEEDELQAGYVLTCQARPKTKELVVSFDA